MADRLHYATAGRNGRHPPAPVDARLVARALLDLAARYALAESEALDDLRDALDALPPERIERLEAALAGLEDALSSAVSD